MARPKDEQFQPIAGLMAAALPGLGYLWFAQPLRAAYVFVSVMALFFGGMLIGGIDVIDRREDRWWFLVQAGVGPTAFVVDHIHQRYYKLDFGNGRRLSGMPDADENPGGVAAPSRKSVGRVNESGMLMAALAGMMNLIAIIDCLWHAPPGVRRRTADRPAGTPATLRVGQNPAPEAKP